MELRNSIIAFYPASGVFRIFYDAYDASLFYGVSIKKIEKCIDTGDIVRGAILKYIDDDKADFLFDISIEYEIYDEND